jgi:hypothetical protein
MLLSRRTRVQPVGDVIASLPDRRPVTTAIMTSPGSASGRSIVSERAREVRAVELPRRMNEPRVALCGSGCTPVLSFPLIAVNTRDFGFLAPLAGDAVAPARTAATRKAMQVALPISRGRLSNIPAGSVRELVPVRNVPSRECHSKQAFTMTDGIGADPGLILRLPGGVLR